MADMQAIEQLLRANNDTMLTQMKQLNEQNNKNLLDMMGKSMDQKIDQLRQEFDQKLAKMTEDKDGNERKRSRSAGPSMGKGVHKNDYDDEYKVKVVGFRTDTRKAAAEETLTNNCAKLEGYVESYMPGGRNDFAYVKFECDSARRRFLNKTHSGELEITHAGQKLRFSRCRTQTQKEKTKHIDKCKRVIIEAIKAKYPNVPDGTFKEKIETGMNDGGVAWIGDVRVAEMVQNDKGAKVFKINAEKVANELRTFGWEIDGQSVVAAHKAAME